MIYMLKGTYTALITPFTDVLKVDYIGLKNLVEFQIENKVDGILSAGTTSESPTLNWDEHNKVIEKVFESCEGKIGNIAGTGSNSTRESIEATHHVSEIGIKAVLLVDPYYNGPSSLEIRREYVEKVAEQFPDIEMIPYVIPGRSGTQLLPQDIAIMNENFPNLNTVKEATGSLENMALTRKLCKDNFSILSGDDDKTFDIMVNEDIKANGVISVVSNLLPNAVSDMINHVLDGNIEKGREIYETIKPLLGMVGVKTIEDTNYGEAVVKARNPLPIKTIMNILGMNAGPLRPPLGKMTKRGIEVVVETTTSVYEKNPELFKSIEDFFNVDIQERLSDKKYREGLYYDSY